MSTPNGRREDIAQAVIIGALTTLVSGLITWGIDEAKQRIADRRAKAKRHKGKRKQ